MNLYKSLQSATYAAPRSSSNAFRKTCVLRYNQVQHKNESILKDIISSVNVVRG